MNPFKGFDVTGNSKLWKNVPKKGLMRFLYVFIYNFSAVIRLNLIFLIFCIPVITLPLALAGMVRVASKMIRLEPVDIWGDFVKSVKQNWKQASVVFYIIAVGIAAACVAFCYYTENGNGSTIAGIGLVICGLIIILLLLMMAYSMAMIVTVELKTRAVLKNALLLCVLGGKNTLSMLLSIIVINGIMVLFLPVSVLFAALMGFAILSLLCFIYAWQPIERYAVSRELPDAA